jgi:ribosomal protein S18 acetylase RimI-like enzyme
MIISSFESFCSEQVLRSCAKLYCEIWREHPWNEEFWTIEGVMDDLKKQASKPGAKGFFAVDGGEVSGFTWGYYATQADMRMISGSESLDRLFCNGECVFYLAELGVCPSLRKHKIGEKLTTHLLESVARDGIRSVVLRTDIKASAARHLYQKVGFRDLQVKDAKHGNRTYWVLAMEPGG